MVSKQPSYAWPQGTTRLEHILNGFHITYMVSKQPSYAWPQGTTRLEHIFNVCTPISSEGMSSPQFWGQYTFRFGQCCCVCTSMRSARVVLPYIGSIRSIGSIGGGKKREEKKGKKSGFKVKGKTYVCQCRNTAEMVCVTVHYRLT